MNAKPLFTPSGFNEKFYGTAELSFANYIQQTREMLIKARIDLNTSNAQKIIDANCPSEWKPQKKSDHPIKKGILLIHGLNDSTFITQDLGKYFCSQGMLARNILLPGHGTLPGDMLNIRYQEWLKAVDYGINSLAKEVDQIFIVGLSLGGVLAVHTALSDPRISGVLLVAPALKIKGQWLLPLLIRLWQMTYVCSSRKNWYVYRDFQYDYAKYESFCCNAVLQIHALIQALNQLLQKTALTVPVFLATSTTDEVIDSQHSLSFFNTLSNRKNRLLWYESEQTMPAYPNITHRTSVYPNERILNFSHYCLPISPDNPHYGQSGDYQDFLRYPNNQPPDNRARFLGAVHPAHLKKHVIQRLSYNPDFDYMAQMMMAFIDSV